MANTAFEELAIHLKSKFLVVIIPAWYMNLSVSAYRIISAIRPTEDSTCRPSSGSQRIFFMA